MPPSREALPQLGSEVFLTDSGLETDLLFNQGVDLPEFAAYPLLKDSDGMGRLRRYFDTHAAWRRRPASGSCSKRSPGGRARSGARCSATTGTG
jgi:hypothetical protein